MVVMAVTLDKDWGGAPRGDDGRAGPLQTVGASQGKTERRASHMEGTEQVKGQRRKTLCDSKGLER